MDCTMVKNKMGQSHYLLLSSVRVASKADSTTGPQFGRAAVLGSLRNILKKNRWEKFFKNQKLQRVTRDLTVSGTVEVRPLCHFLPWLSLHPAQPQSWWQNRETSITGFLTSIHMKGLLSEFEKEGQFQSNIQNFAITFNISALQKQVYQPASSSALILPS